MTLVNGNRLIEKRDQKYPIQQIIKKVTEELKRVFGIELIEGFPASNSENIISNIFANTKMSIILFHRISCYIYICNKKIISSEQFKR